MSSGVSQLNKYFSFLFSCVAVIVVISWPTSVIRFLCLPFYFELLSIIDHSFVYH